MAGRIPTAGFATRTEAVLAMRASGHSTRQIADALGIEPKSVTALEISAVRTAKRAPASVQSGRGVLLPMEVLNRMRRPASKRGMEPHELAVRIVRTVVMDGMIDAVLDDDVAG